MTALRALVLSALLLGTSLDAQKDLVATPTAPMGWNSWDAYGLTITEPQFRDNVKVLHEKLQPFGYKYAVIDEGWFFENPQDRETPDKLRYAIDGNGRYIPTALRFRSAGDREQSLMILGAREGEPSPKLAARIQFSGLYAGFKPLADFVHAQGLLFGIHIVRGIPRASVERNLPIANSKFTTTEAADTTDACPWDPTNWGVKDTPAGQAWYDSLITQYAAWGIDLLKVDCISDHPYRADEIRMIRRAIDKVGDKTGRPMVLSLSPGPTNPSHAQEVASLSTMWRISNDVWDLWQGGGGAKYDGFPQSIKGQFDHAAQWAALDIPAGHYPDLDMLPFGELGPVPGWGKPRQTRLTPDEERTLLTLWAMMRSPLILGANLTLLDDETLKLLTNKDLIALDQYGTGGGRMVPPVENYDERLPKLSPDLQVWGSTIQRADQPVSHAVAIFNLGDHPTAVGKATTLLPSSSLKKGSIPRDSWTGEPILASTKVPAHGCILAIGN
ncbi:Alpha galactosidase A [Bryocella elongata]|uniref:Alpha galactosidase A n=1 Tax=Bryocella elongata TaxID=863522 RepID=A0A1H5YN46_9BACT|nr:glycoside hydrolase family 27 protein [Bryocella elongata]SEG25414.1 Alpha galactosidase A [Bryocella elongata]